MMPVMKKVSILIFLLMCALGISEEPSFEPSDGRLVVNNRILARIQNKTISVLDVMKRMDVQLARSYPQYADNPVARYQFFTNQWRTTLNQMIDNELMLADAEKLELKVNDADVREQLHERFGPNIMPTLDKLGITYDEAWQMIHAENVVQRMNWYRVQSKAVNGIGPKDVKEAYKKYCALNPPVETWKYQVLSIRSPDEKTGALWAEKARQDLKSEGVDFKLVGEKAKELLDSSITFNVSEDYEVTGKNLSESHKAILTSLAVGTYSEPVKQVSRFDKSIVHRIFHLKDHQVTQTASFKEKYEELYEDLVQRAIDKEAKTYLIKVRERFNFDEKFLLDIPNDFVPFSFR
ncbi:MAG TPA: SurA N-terminal domain-containing protein [Rhabdochlamydiaceae bacterium]|nr:SurA N-terminal domain-containing protein [Rhabdochlamydiaceae bacterium]